MWCKIEGSCWRLLEEITSTEIVATCFPNGVSVDAQSLYQVQLHEWDQSEVTLGHWQQFDTKSKWKLRNPW